MMSTYPYLVVHLPDEGVWIVRDVRDGADDPRRFPSQISAYQAAASAARPQYAGAQYVPDGGIDDFFLCVECDSDVVAGDSPAADASLSRVVLTRTGVDRLAAARDEGIVCRTCGEYL